MKLKNNIAISDSGLIFNPSTGESFSMNATAAEIIQLLKQGKEESFIANELGNKYGLDVVEVERDLLDFINILQQHQIIEQQ
jgi:hypothetical protein